MRKFILLLVFLFCCGFMFIGGKPSDGVIDGTIGAATVSGNTERFAANGKIHSKFQPGTAGTVQNGHAYISDSNGETICIAIFNSAGTELISCTGTIVDDTPGWVNCVAGSSIVLVAATDYYLSTNLEDGGGSFFPAWDNAAGTSWRDDSNVACGNNLDVKEETQLSASYKGTVIWNNTPGDPS